MAFKIWVNVKNRDMTLFIKLISITSIKLIIVKLHKSEYGFRILLSYQYHSKVYLLFNGTSVLIYKKPQI